MRKEFIEFYSSDEIENEFHAAVDDYLEYCEEIGAKPCKPYSGTFNVRIGAEKHRALAMAAFRNGANLNQAVQAAVDEYLEKYEPARLMRILETNAYNTSDGSEVSDLFSQILFTQH